MSRPLPDRSDPAVDHLDDGVGQPAIERRVRDARGTDELPSRQRGLQRRAARDGAGR